MSVNLYVYTTEYLDREKCHPVGHHSNGSMDTAVLLADSSLKVWLLKANALDGSAEQFWLVAGESWTETFL